MERSLSAENARLRVLLDTQQRSLEQMAEYNRLLSQRVAAYASEISRLKALVAKLQRMQFGKISEKLREKTQRQVRQADERTSALQEEMAEVLGEQHDPVLPSPLRQSSARKPLPASLPREICTLTPEETACPAFGGKLSALGCDVSEQLELISSAFKVIETQRPKLTCRRCDHIVQPPEPSKTHPTRLRRPRPAGAHHHGEVRGAHASLSSFGDIPPSGRGAEPGHAGALVRRGEQTTEAAVRPAAPLRADAG